MGARDGHNVTNAAVEKPPAPSIDEQIAAIRHYQAVARSNLANFVSGAGQHAELRAIYERRVRCLEATVARLEAAKP